ncbi:SigB/SigF/SigG family RNA polymerase sigma factor [Kitasatospora sp. McL0602]|uniref:SigB/SigF/SigG family RNA polymerase sigma factor n=1 Tax=Kitasatospora sp. McL0602 TaxID=3439530 RepID=UPI003F88623C
MTATADELPVIDHPLAASTGDARELSRVLLWRLRKLEPGSEEYSYVRGTLIELNVSLVRFAARRFGGSHESMDDIVQAGTVGLVKAVDRFDPDRGVEFATFALPTVIGEIRRFFRDTTWAVHVPRRLQEARLAVVKGADELEQELGRAPTVGELAEYVALQPAELDEAMQAAQARTTLSLDAPFSDGNAEGALECRLGCCDPALEVVEYVQSLKPLIAALPERERTILALRFTEGLTQAEIGRRLGISQMHVSRLLTRSLEGLRAGLTGQGCAPPH